MSEIGDIMRKDRCSWREAKAKADAALPPVLSEALLDAMTRRVVDLIWNCTTNRTVADVVKILELEYGKANVKAHAEFMASNISGQPRLAQQEKP